MKKANEMNPSTYEVVLFLENEISKMVGLEMNDEKFNELTEHCWNIYKKNKCGIMSYTASFTMNLIYAFADMYCVNLKLSWKK